MEKTVKQMAMIAVLALVLGLGRNFFGKNRLPFFSHQNRVDAVLRDMNADFQEADADLVRQLAGQPGVAVVDARPSALFRDGHIPGAQSLPIGDFAAAFALAGPRLAGRGSIIVYCQGLTCHDSLLLLQKLWDNGLRHLLLYRGGMDEWRQRGLTIEK